MGTALLQTLLLFQRWTAERRDRLTEYQRVVCDLTAGRYPGAGPGLSIGAGAPHSREESMLTKEVTAKFKVSGVGAPYDGQVNIALLVDYEDGRNKEWAKYTPSGQIQMTVKESVAPAFPLNQAFLVTFTPDD
jgi:hypothetical protein